MARAERSPIARDDSQLFPRGACEAATAQSSRERIDRDRNEVEALGAGEAALNDQAIAGQPLAPDDLAQIIGKVFER